MMRLFIHLSHCWVVTAFWVLEEIREKKGRSTSAKWHFKQRNIVTLSACRWTSNIKNSNFPFGWLTGYIIITKHHYVSSGVARNSFPSMSMYVATDERPGTPSSNIIQPGMAIEEGGMGMQQQSLISCECYYKHNNNSMNLYYIGM